MCSLPLSVALDAGNPVNKMSLLDQNESDYATGPTESEISTLETLPENICVYIYRRSYFTVVEYFQTFFLGYLQSL